MLYRFAGVLPLLMLSTLALHAQESSLTVDQIMQAPETWIGSWPRNVSWAEDGSALYFWWNPKGEFPADSLYMVERGSTTPVKVAPEQRRLPSTRFSGWSHGSHIYNADFSRKVFEEAGDIFIFNRLDGSTQRLTQTLERESNPRFTPDGTAVVFRRGNNLFRRDLVTGLERQLTDLRRGKEPSDSERSAQQEFLFQQEQELIDYIRKQTAEREARDASREKDQKARQLPPTFYYGEGTIQQLQLSPDGRYVNIAISRPPSASGGTEVHAYVTETGYATNLDARPKVGSPVATSQHYIQDLNRDTTYTVDLHQLPGAYDVPEYRRQMGIEADSSRTRRDLFASGMLWSADGAYAVMDVRARDNKTRWIVRLTTERGELTVLDRQHDEAWIGGPGVSWWAPSMGWLPDGRRLFYQSEVSGYSHLYVVDILSGERRRLTNGEFEIFDPQLSQDGSTWFFTSSEESAFVRHFYSMPVDGGARTRLTSMRGMNDFVLDPREESLAILHSFTTQPPEIYVQTDLRQAGTTRRITHSPTDEWLSYNWREGEIIHIEASDGVDVPTQIFRPEQPNGAAVLFVHGAGYLQNVHHGWSNYFREYMFHNLLTDLGYVVLNVDFRASSGYGRDWRTAIYRHMGGRDLQDYVDASRYLQDEHQIDPERVFIYGGSYGGFITLMALFTESEHFGGGAALRSVTDWAHYNHGYTSNILNTPAEDSLAYRRSSPIYFAEGLEDPLLLAHGIVDVNVQFQDVVRLAQRLIELGKEDWEMAVYPVEDHGFTEPESWADEYRRILKYIRLSVGPEEAAKDEIPFLRSRPLQTESN